MIENIPHKPLVDALTLFRDNALLLSLRADSSASPDAWTPENPTLGQCAVVALVVQDKFGGNIVNVTATPPGKNSESHYYNEIDGFEVDLTRAQYPENTVFSKPASKAKEFATTRDYILSYEPTAQRYRYLHSRIGIETIISQTKKLA